MCIASPFRAMSSGTEGDRPGHNNGMSSQVAVCECKLDLYSAFGHSQVELFTRTILHLQFTAQKSHSAGGFIRALTSSESMTELKLSDSSFFTADAQSISC